MIVGGRFTPAHVSPVSRAGVHRAEVTRSCTASANKGGAGVGVGKSNSAVSGAVDHVSPGAPAAGKAAIAAVFVHAGHVHVAVELVDSDLDVSNKHGPGRNWKVHRRTPSDTVITRARHRDGRTSIREVVPGNVHPVGEWRGWVLIHRTRLSVVIESS